LSRATDKQIYQFCIIIDGGRQMKKILTFGIMLLFLGMTISSTGFNIEKQTFIATYNGNTLYVGGSGPGNYTEIQDAIDDASDGDTVFVYNGTYYENVIVNKTINFLGEDKDKTVINGYSYNHCIDVISDWVNVSGFSTIKGDGTGIQIHSNHTSIIDNIISDNWFGIYLYDSHNNIISNNRIINNDYGMFFSYSNKNTVVSNAITSNGDYGLELFYWSKRRTYHNRCL
jgi:parallel beta-helix repeat protein